jgi:hypothetical protein
MHTIFDPKTHEAIIGRIRTLRPDAARRFGRMTAPEMVAHLTDQMRHTLGDAKAEAQPGILRTALVRYLVIYWLPWPKGKVKGPPEAFVTKPRDWEADVDTLIRLVNRFVIHGPGGDWPEHAFFGRMTGKDWGVFCHKHFNHHLSQFGV